MSGLVSVKRSKGYIEKLRRMELKDRKISQLYLQQDVLISYIENICEAIDDEQQLPPGMLYEINKLLEYIQKIDTRARSQRNARLNK